jgi:FAD/FMN-containing dehydrogenase
MIKPGNIEEVQAILAACFRDSAKASVFDLSLLNKMVEYSPEDMTATVQAGMLLDDFQALIGVRGQWLPLDPPAVRNWTMSDLILENGSGPRRCGYGTVRDYLLGIRVVLADGRLIKAGGKVVKNVAGYDLCKLFVNSKGTLGIPVEATFKLKPRPELEVLLEEPFSELSAAGLMVEKLLHSPLQPTILDLASVGESHVVRLGFDGPREDVAYQLTIAEELGMKSPGSDSSGKEFWQGEPPSRTSVLPSTLIPTIQRLKPDSYVARATQGILYYRGGLSVPPRVRQVELTKRIKDTYDPRGVLPALQP